jgi:hypothetical protein
MPAKDVGETVGEFYLPGGYLLPLAFGRTSEAPSGSHGMGYQG